MKFILIQEGKGPHTFKFVSMFHKLLLIVLCIAFTTTAYAQKYELTSSSKKAIKYYEEAVSLYQYDEYSEAIDLLKRSLKHDDNFIEAWLLLGDSYSEVNSVNDAIISYESAILIDSNFFQGVYYFLGNLNYEIGEYQKAVDYYIILSQMPEVSKELLMLTYSRLIFASTSAQLVNNPVPVNMRNTGPPINTNNDEYINYVNSLGDYMMLTRRTKLISSTERKPMYKEELLFSNRIDLVWENPIPVNLSWRNNLDMGSLNLSTDGRSMYFTGCYWPMGIGGCDLYVSHSSGGKWLEPKNLGDRINSSKWESQPIISSDNKKLYFASKRAGGKGGSDIWMSVKLKDNSWSPPINLGDSINTPKDEMTPFIHADGNTMFFASNGHPGLGGYDLFISRQDELGRWSLAKNIGYPTNSRFDDINIFVSIDGKRSWISSNRDDSEGNMDIYWFNNYVDILPKKIMYVEGTIVDKVTRVPLKAEVQITNLNTSEVINTTLSDSITGAFLIVVYPGIDYAFNISKQGYLFLSQNINLRDSIGVGSVKKQFELSQIALGKQLIMNNVFFKFNDYELLPSSFIELNKLAKFLVLNSSINIEIIGHTDNIGSADYNMKLSMNRANSVNNYLINKGIDSLRLIPSGMGDTKPLTSNISEQGRATNRRTEIRIK